MHGDWVATAELYSGEFMPLTWPFRRVSGFIFFLGTNPLFTRMVILE